ncbi:MAG TPA: tRNA (adenosine(37)-N6)-dimethylallyltransferase MiaA [Gaiellaceae bacterium]|nr:tRNA (adenosine(37)-N6)-dimethylallyltransferase MiaA [Gaiellaceae bacterium]
MTEVRPRVIAIFGPTACGKTAVAGALRERLGAEAVSADSAALYACLPVITAAPPYPTRLVGIVPLSADVSVGEYQRLAHAAIDELVAAGTTPVVVGGTGLYLRAALSSLELPPPPAPGARERWSALYEEVGPEAAHALLAERDPGAAARVHANDRRRVVRALELVEAGSSLAPAEDRLWAEETRHPTVVVGMDCAAEELDRRIETRSREMLEQGAVQEAGRAWAGSLSNTARKILGLEEFATLAPEEAVESVTAASRRLSRYQRKWLRRLSLAATLDAARPPEEIADEIVALAGAGERLPPH